jgi:hypothetical protein
MVKRAEMGRADFFPAGSAFAPEAGAAHLRCTLFLLRARF